VSAGESQNALEDYALLLMTATANAGMLVVYAIGYHGDSRCTCHYAQQLTA